MRYLFTLPVLIAGSALANAQSELPEPLRTAIEGNDAVPTFSFDVERTSTDTGEDGETRTAYARVNLTAPEFKQITPAHLIDSEQPGSSFSALAGIENAIEDGIWCSGLVSTSPDPDDVEIIAEDSETITYQFRPATAEDADGPEKKIARRSLVTVVVSREDPAILSYERHLTKTVTLYVVAKIKSVDLSVQCARGPSGNTYAQHMTNAFEATGFGDGGGNRSEMTVTAIYDAATGTMLAQN